MKRRSIVNLVLFLLASCIAALLFSSCSGFWTRSDNHYVRQENAAKFMNSIRPYRGDAESHYRFACFLQERKKYALAVVEFKTVVEIDPKNVKAYNRLGISYDALGEYDQAIEAYESALKVNHNLDYVLNNLGYSYLLEGHLNLAVQNFKKAITLNDKNKRYHNNLGLAYAREGELKAAFEEFRLAGGVAEACHNIAQFCQTEGGHEGRSHAGRSAKRADRVLKGANSLANIFWGSDSLKKSKATDSSVLPQRVNEDGFYTIRTGTFGNPEEAKIKKARLREKGYEAFIHENGVGKDRYTVNVGLFPNREEAEAAALRMNDSDGIKTLAVPAKDDRAMVSREEKILGEMRIKERPGVGFTAVRKPASLRTKIEVSNGNGVRRMARRVGNYLNEKGFQLMYLTNANNFHHAKTRILYSGNHFKEAYRLAQDLPGRQDIEKVPRLPREKAKIKVLLGKDLIPYDALFHKS